MGWILRKIDLEFIPEARRVFWKLWSIRLSLISAALSGLYGAFDALQAMIPPVQFVCLNMALSVAVIVSRVVYQPEVHE